MSLGSRFGRVLVFLLLVCLIITPLASAEYQPKPITDAEPEPSVPAAPAAPVVKPGPRLIVELEKAPLATWPDGDAVVMSVRGKLDAKSPEAQAYMQVLKADQDSFVRALARNPQLANSIRPATFQTEQGATRMLAFQAALNAVTVDVNGMDLAQAERVLLAMKGVKAVYREYAYTPALYASNPLINSQVIWNLVGGQARGGEGIKIASMDGGLHKDAPMFDGTGYRLSLAVDATGVGRPVVDLLRTAGLRPIAVTVTGGDTATNEGTNWKIPKRELVTGVQVALQQGRLRIARALPEAETLIRELTNYKVTISDTGHDSYGAWRESDHDDLVFAVGLAVWSAGRERRHYAVVSRRDW